MSNKTQLQTNNTQYASLIETLRGKAVSSGGEDVTDETAAYTTKLATLETAISALESELEGKASGGSGGTSIETCTVTVTCPNATDWGYAYTAYNGTVITSIGLLSVGQNTLTLENVICRSSIFLYDTRGEEPFLQLSDATMQIMWWTTGCGQIMAPASAGTQATIMCYID